MKTKLYILLSGFLLIITSCGKEWLDVNTDPNNPSTASLENVFPAGVMSVGAQMNSYYNIAGGMWAQIWTQNNSSNQYKNFDSYNITPALLDAQFNELYSGGLNDFEFVRQEALKKEDWRFYLMATVMQVYTFQILVDLYDKIPYSEAFKGKDGVYSPKYDNGDAVYNDLIARLDTALNKDLTKPEYDPNSSAFISLNSDIIFRGDIEQWIRFANTLKLKIYLRQADARPDVALSGINAMMIDDANFPGFLETDAAIAPFKDEASKSNPLYECDQRQLNTTNNIKASYTFMSWLQDNSDTRIPMLFMKNSLNDYAGMYQGNFEAATTEVDPATISRALINATDPVIFISAAESYFLQAEANLRWNVGAPAVDGYDNGVYYAFERFGLEDDALDLLGYTAPADDILPDNYAYPDGTFEENLEAIIVQKWASLAGNNGIEAFIEKNRTGFPKTSTVAASDPSYVPGTFTDPIFSVLAAGQYPKRLMFTETEVSRNKNVPASVPATTPVWWDVN
jgi:hypothetical protein